ncbi:MAG: GIY-YIG nuclease family protein [Bdellovibrionales bacterium]
MSPESLRKCKVLFLDCQTTGMRPPSGQVLELAWQVNGAPVESHLLRLPEGASIPSRVREMTGLSEHNLKDAREARDVIAHLSEQIRALEPAVAVIHYAQFERPFLKDLFRRHLDLDDLPLSILCTHQLSKRLFPRLPSRNIRAVAGYFGTPVIGPHRAGTFVEATRQIWEGLCPDLDRLGLTDISTIQEWLQSKPPPKSSRYVYRMERVKRLNLPESPGVYRMLAKNGQVLYVGKATSLRARVNSYFRGKKGRDAKTLEMLAQVWDFEITPCGSPLEAALLESDEIKRLNPPYNIVLKTGRRHLVYYARDFASCTTTQSVTHPIGPFRNQNWIEHLRLLELSIRSGRFQQIFFNPLPEENLRAGFELFCQQQNDPDLQTVRDFLAFGLRLYRVHKEQKEQTESGEPGELPEPHSSKETKESAEDSAPREVTVEEIAAKFERLLRRAGAEYARSKKLTRLLNSRILLDSSRRLEFRHGHYDHFHQYDHPGSSARPPSSSTLPWAHLGIETFDRMSILQAELDRSQGAQVERLR